MISFLRRHFLNKKTPRKGRGGRFAAASILIVSFIAGYMTLSANNKTCSAALIPGVPVAPVPGTICGCGVLPSVPCNIVGSTAVAAGSIESAYYAALVVSAGVVENVIGAAVDTLVQAVFSRLEQAEKDLVDWFETFWYYNQRPSMQDAVEQINTVQMEQAKELAAAQDAQLQARSALERDVRAHEAARSADATVNKQTCQTASSAGGFGRANVFSRSMRRAWQNEFVAESSNRLGAPAANGVAAAVREQAESFEQNFCDPRDNGGNNNCGATDPAFYNADTEVTARLFNALTIPVNEDPRHALALEQMQRNLVGAVRHENLSEEVAKTAAGKEVVMERRSYLARKNAARSVPSLVASWRMPGGQNGNFTTALREGAGIGLEDISDNPSYREIMHAITIDRFNSGQ